MLLKNHLTSHSRMSGSRWVIIPSWLSRSWRSFLCSFCVLFPPLLNIFCFCEVHTISVLYWVHLCMNCSLGIPNVLEEISSFSHSIVFLYFFALITEESFLISPWCSLELCFQMGISLFFSFAFLLLFFSQLFVRPPQTAIFFLHFFFLGIFLLPVSCIISEPPSIIHQACYQIYSLKSISHFHCIVIRDLI